MGLKFAKFVIILQNWIVGNQQPTVAKSSLPFLPQDSVKIRKTNGNRQKIGEGSFANVYKGSQLGEQRAVKVFRENAITIEQAQEEFEMLSSLTHPNIVCVHGMWRDPHKGRNALAIVMELCDCSLRKYIREHFVRGISTTHSLDILHDITTGMIYLHSQNIIHGDLRAPNVLVNEVHDRITAKLAGFGAAHFSGPTKFIKETDVFCFGSLAIELACGKFPEPAAKVQAMDGKIVKTYTEIERRAKYLRKMKPAEHMYTDPIVEQCMADRPEERRSFVDLKIIIEDLQQKYQSENQLDEEWSECQQFSQETEVPTLHEKENGIIHLPEQTSEREINRFLRESTEVKAQYENSQEEQNVNPRENRKEIAHLKEMLMEREVSEPVHSFIIVCVTLILLASPYSQSS
jgi:serine/threonine protein kinase